MIRPGKPADENLVARRLMSSPLKLFANEQLSSRYDLTDYQSVLQIGRVKVSIDGIPDPWLLKDDKGRTFVFDTPPMVTVGDPIIAIAVMSGGVGLGFFPALFANRLCQQYGLVPVLPELSSESLDMYVSFAERRSAVPAVRTFVDEIIEYTERLKSGAELPYG